MPWPPGWPAPMPLVPVWNSPSTRPSPRTPFVHGPVALVVGRESLKRGVKLHAFQAQIGDARKLFHGAFALERVHAAESDERLGVVAARLGDELVRHPRPARRRLRVPRQEHGEKVELPVVAGELLERAAAPL